MTIEQNTQTALENTLQEWTLAKGLNNKENCYEIVIFY